MASERSATSKGIAALPLLLMALVHLTVTPLREMFKVESTLMYAWYAIALTLAVILWRKSSMVRDHEFHRSQVMKRMKKVYDAEEAGVWQSNAALGSELSADAQLKLQGQVASIDGEAPEMTVDQDDRVDVTMLTDANHIQRANRSMNGKESFGEQGTDSTIGAVRKKSPMDSVLDFLGGLFGRHDAAQRRENRRQSRLQAAASADPVTAQRPVAPLRTSTQSQEDNTLKLTSMSDEGGIDSTVNATGEVVMGSGTASEAANVYAWDNPAANSNSNSIESMAMLSTPLSTSAPIIQPVHVQGLRCKGCQNPVPEGERFCPHCGLDV
ncbi:MAG: zinc ribbon domain-containing protein [Candidatus Poseidoniaceae archaeon]|nr:zinc ribbon domain-containing protein [Candidatus Poseidoniaceae archaeon]